MPDDHAFDVEEVTQEASAGGETMTSVIKCDVCGAIYEHSQSGYFVAYDRSGQVLEDGEFCSRCAARVAVFIRGLRKATKK